MAEKKLQAELVISAADKTGAVFDKVGARFDRLAAAGKRIGGVGRDFLNVASAVDRNEASLGRAARAADTLHGRMARLDKIFGRNMASISGFSRALGSGIAAMTAYTAVERTVEATASAAATRQHERVRMETAGMTPGEIGEAEKAAAKVSAEVPAVSQTTALHMLRNARSIVGSYEEAAKLIEPLAKLRVVAEGAHPEQKEELDEDFDKLIKSEEIKGATRDLPRFTKNMDLMAKALNAFGDTLRPTDFYAMVKYARGASQSLSDEFFLKTAPTFAQEMGGSSAGKAFGTAYATIVGGRGRAVAYNELKNLDLLNPGTYQTSKAGIVTKWRPGAVKGWELFATDPYRWAQEIWLPALTRKGITDRQKILSETAIVFRDQTAQQFMDVLETQQPRIEKDWRISAGAEGLAAADTFMNKDPYVALSSFTAQLKNLLQVAGGPLMPPAIDAMNYLASSMGHMADAAAKSPAVQQALSRGLAVGSAGAGLGLDAVAINLLGRFATAETWLGTVMRAPLKFARFGVEGPALPFYLATQDAFAQGTKQIDETLARHYQGAPWAKGLWESDQPVAMASPAETPKAQLAGDATLNVHVTIDHDLNTWADTYLDGDISGVKVRGTTGDLGRSWPDVGR